VLLLDALQALVSRVPAFGPAWLDHDPRCKMPNMTSRHHQHQQCETSTEIVVEMKHPISTTHAMIAFVH
jgi:hypothetical protein